MWPSYLVFAKSLLPLYLSLIKFPNILSPFLMKFGKKLYSIILDGWNIEQSITYTGISDAYYMCKFHLFLKLILHKHAKWSLRQMWTIWKKVWEGIECIITLRINVIVFGFIIPYKLTSWHLLKLLLYTEQVYLDLHLLTIYELYVLYIYYQILRK